MKRFIVVFLITICFGQMMLVVQTTEAADFCQWQKILYTRTGMGLIGQPGRRNRHTFY